MELDEFPVLFVFSGQSSRVFVDVELEIVAFEDFGDRGEWGVGILPVLLISRILKRHLPPPPPNIPTQEKLSLLHPSGPLFRLRSPHNLAFRLLLEVFEHERVTHRVGMRHREPLSR